MTDQPDMRKVCEALGFDPTNHHNAAKCPYCNFPAPPPPAPDREGRKDNGSSQDAVVGLQAPGVTGWRPIETAPKDGTRILAWTVHANAAYSKDPMTDGWACPSVIQWIDHNGGGWTWNGLGGVHTHWQPLPPPPHSPPHTPNAVQSQGVGGMVELEKGALGDG